MSVDLPEPFGPSSPSVSPRISVAFRSSISTRSSTPIVACSAEIHAIAAAFGDLEANRHRAVFADRRAQTRHALETLASPLRLLGVLSGEVARDVVLLARDLSLLLDRTAAAA